MVCLTKTISLWWVSLAGASFIKPWRMANIKIPLMYANTTVSTSFLEAQVEMEWQVGFIISSLLCCCQSQVNYPLEHLLTEGAKHLQLFQDPGEVLRLHLGLWVVRCLVLQRVEGICFQILPQLCLKETVPFCLQGILFKLRNALLLKIYHRLDTMLWNGPVPGLRCRACSDSSHSRRVMT